MTTQTELAIDTSATHPSVAHTKRLLEYWTADKEFRQAYDANPVETARRYGLTAEPAKIRALLDPNGIGIESEEVSAYRAFIRSKLEFRRRYRLEGAPSNPRFRAWRERQIKRVSWELGPMRADAVVHAPVCFELSKGCTVGCWFCGVSAEPFGGNFEYSKSNAALWRGILDALRELIGPATGCGFCYWATDPLDNPDYERFIVDYHEITGRLPQTTTAQPLKDQARTRALLEISHQLSCCVERFSVLSIGQFRRIMEAFTPEELLMVELIPQFNHDASPKVAAGAVHNKLVKSAGTGLPKNSTRNTEDGGSIACVSGFLVNMVERVARLISPCSANKRRPMGYIVFDEFRFDTPFEFRVGVEAAISRAMKMHVGCDDSVQLNPHLTIERQKEGLRLSNSSWSLNLTSQVEPVVLAEMIGTGATLAEIANARAERCGVPHLWTHQEVHGLWSEGLLDEEIFLEPRK
jgi:radical SAM family RiPP maturation amino acid epimerase